MNRDDNSTGVIDWGWPELAASDWTRKSQTSQVFGFSKSPGPRNHTHPKR
jgi:hypothetical protein